MTAKGRKGRLSWWDERSGSSNWMKNYRGEHTKFKVKYTKTRAQNAADADLISFFIVILWKFFLLVVISLPYLIYIFISILWTIHKKRQQKKLEKAKIAREKELEEKKIAQIVKQCQLEQDKIYAGDVTTKSMRCIKEGNMRYILQTDLTKNPLFVIGVNPSTADDKHDDPTVKNIKKIAQNNGYDGVAILNLYPLICTSPNDLPDAADAKIHYQNKQTIAAAIQHCEKFCRTPLTVWCAWGDLIKKRDYLKKFSSEIIKLFPENTNYVCISKTKSGNPSHPLYQKSDSELVPYNIAIKLEESAGKNVAKCCAHPLQKDLH